MKTLGSIILLMTISLSSMAGTDVYECYPETARSDQQILLKVDFKNKTAGLKLGKRGVYGCSKVKFKNKGDVRDYGEAQLTFNCRGQKVTLRRNYDEEILELGTKLQRKLKLDDSTYMCE